MVHLSWGLLPVRVNGSCPELPAEMVNRLISEYELLQKVGQEKRATRLQCWEELQVKSMSAPEGTALSWLSSTAASEGLSVPVQLKFLRLMFPELPQEVAVRVVCDPSFDAGKVPYNRRVRRKLFNPHVPTLVHLFPGAQKWQDCTGQVLGVELTAGSDLLSDDIFGMLLAAASQGSIQGCVGGPPCRTTSACRCADDGGPRPVRAREGVERFGLVSNTETEQALAALVDNDSVLWFRTMLLFMVIAASLDTKPFLAWEHADDPACWSSEPRLKACPSFPEFQVVYSGLQSWLARFDQGLLGHAKRKPTGLCTTSWSVCESLHAIHGEGSGQPSELPLVLGFSQPRGPDGLGWSEL